MIAEEKLIEVVDNFMSFEEFKKETTRTKLIIRGEPAKVFQNLTHSITGKLYGELGAHKAHLIHLAFRVLIMRNFETFKRDTIIDGIDANFLGPYLHTSPTYSFVTKMSDVLTYDSNSELNNLIEEADAIYQYIEE